MVGKGSILTPTSAANTAAPKLSEAVTRFLLDRNIAGCTAPTIAAYRFQLKPFVAWCGERSLDLGSVGEEDVRTFLGVRQQVSQETLGAACIRLKTFFSGANAKGSARTPRAVFGALSWRKRSSRR